MASNLLGAVPFGTSPLQKNEGLEEGSIPTVSLADRQFQTVRLKRSEFRGTWNVFSVNWPITSDLWYWGCRSAGDRWRRQIATRGPMP